MRKVSLSIIIAGWMLWAGLSECVAQNLPININVTLTPPHSIYLSDYSQIGRDPLRVQILLNDFNAFNVKTKLHVRIENSRGTIRLRTRDAYQPPQGLFLDGGIPLFISGGDLAPYMSYETMEVSGINTNELRRSGGKLPEDLYKFCFQVRDFNRNVALSNEVCGEAWLALNEPPLLNFPSNNESVRASYPQNVVFQWVPGRLSPNSAFAVEYKFELFEMMVPNIDPNIMAQRSIPIYEEVVMGTRLLYDMTKPDLVLGRQYAYRVTAQNANNFDGARSLFKNEGRSVVHAFTYGEECRPLKDVDASGSNSSSISMDWGADVTGLYSEYDIRYRKKGRTDWTTESSYFNSHRIGGLAEGLTFEVSARGVCGTVTSEWSPAIEVSTPDAAQAEAERLESVNCGVEPKPSPISNRKPLSTLTKGQVVKTGGGFEMLVTKASGNNGTFSGEGIVSVPMMAGGGMIVKFDGIKVNDEYRHYGGKIQSMYDKQGKGIADLNKYKEDAGVNNVVQNKNVEKKNADNKPVDPTKLTDANGAKPDKIEKVEGKIKEVKKNEKGEVVVVKEDGSEEVIKTEEGKSTEIVDSEGNKHTVGKDGSISKGTPTVGEGLAGGTGGVTGGSRGGSGSSSSSEGEKDKEEDQQSQDAYRLVFSPTKGMKYGYDAYPDVPQLRARYTQKDILGNTYEVAWKAIGPDGDKVGIDLEGAPDSVWKKLTDINDNPLGASAQTKTLQIVPGTLDPLEVMLAGDTTDPVQVGELRIATYNQVEQNTVVVVSVNGAKAPTGLENSLNQIYGQAVASWQVHTDDITGVDYDWGFSGNGALDINTVLGNYTREMNNVISAYVEKKKSDLDNDKFYIFVMKRAEESGVAGRMPMANRVGFVFSDAGGNDGRVIAHELGHGAFNLRHPFGSDGVGTAKGSTDNLMDYSTGTHLWKHQWDNIHEPIDISFWESLVGSSDEESDYKGKGDDKWFVACDLQEFKTQEEKRACWLDQIEKLGGKDGKEFKKIINDLLSEGELTEFEFKSVIDTVIHKYYLTVKGKWLMFASITTLDIISVLTSAAFPTSVISNAKRPVSALFSRIKNPKASKSSTYSTSNVLPVTQKNLTSEVRPLNITFKNKWVAFVKTSSKKWRIALFDKKLYNSRGQHKWYTKDGGIKWPPNDGFIGKIKNITLKRGTVIDRYGRRTGQYASPKGTSYAERALPPGTQNATLNTYKVIRPIKNVKSGKSAPWFGEKGGGIQYKFDKSIEQLVDQGYLKVVK